MKKLIPVLPYLIVTAVIFYLLPTLDKDTDVFILVSLLAVPVFCFVSALRFGLKNGFHWFYPILIAVLFFPTFFQILNVSAFLYVIIYGAMAFAGILLGNMIANREK